MKSTDETKQTVGRYLLSRDDPKLRPFHLMNPRSLSDWLSGHGIY